VWFSCLSSKMCQLARVPPTILDCSWPDPHPSERIQEAPHLSLGVKQSGPRRQQKSRVGVSNNTISVFLTLLQSLFTHQSSRLIFSLRLSHPISAARFPISFPFSPPLRSISPTHINPTGSPAAGELEAARRSQDAD